MKSKSEILEQQENAQGYKITEYVGKDGYVWQMILSAMEEYAQQQVNGVKTSREPALNLAGVSKSLLEKERSAGYSEGWQCCLDAHGLDE